MSLPETITFVTGNAGKVEEMRALLDPLGIAVVPDDRGYPEIQHEELSGVAEAGAGYLLAMGLQPPFMLEDAGLFISALRGFPGVYSANAQATIGNSGILALLQDVELENRGAAFRANLCYVDAGGQPHHFEGTAKGRIAQRAAGTNGFGFDPIFVGAGDDRTFAELPSSEKNERSHRGRAATEFVAWLRQ
jgi:XTP/dITP diphosphohydrolase